MEDEIVIQYALTKEEEDAILTAPPDDEELAKGVENLILDREITEVEKYKYKIGKLYDILLNYQENSNFFHEHVLSIIGYFILMEDKRKPASEIEIYTHCKYMQSGGKEEPKFIMEHCRKIGCANCDYSDKEILEKIFQLKSDIESFGYYTDIRSPFVSFNYYIYVSKVKELIDIIKKVPDINVFPIHVGIRGLIFGYSIEEIATFMDANEEQIEIDEEIANKVYELIENLIKKGILKDITHNIILVNPKINNWLSQFSQGHHHD